MLHQNVLITGTNRGIGYELVRQIVNLQQPPKNVIATTRTTSDKLNKLKSQHSNLKILIYDATNFDSYPEFVKQVESIVGSDGLDLLINNAGVYLNNTIERVTPSELLKNLEVNAVAPFILTQSLLPLLRQSAINHRKTVIVNISSGVGSISDIARYNVSPSYRISKSALNMASAALAAELKPEGIIVLSLCPGWVQTDMGGANAPITPETSIKGIFKVIEQLDIEQTGSYKNYTGATLDW